MIPFIGKVQTQENLERQEVNLWFARVGGVGELGDDS